MPNNYAPDVARVFDRMLLDVGTQSRLCYFCELCALCQGRLDPALVRMAFSVVFSQQIQSLIFVSVRPEEDGLAMSGHAS